MSESSKELDISKGLHRNAKKKEIKDAYIRLSKVAGKFVKKGFSRKIIRLEKSGKV